MNSDTRQKPCRECGLPQATRQGADFCSQKCRMAWHNRRRDRGAELYDIFMASRWEREKWEKEGRAILSRLATAYRDADRAKRDGRPSWDIESRVERIPLAYSTDGDGR